MGFAHFAVSLTADLNTSFSELTQACDDLPPDPYCEVQNRFRRLQYFTALPWCDHVVARPVSHYQQDSAFNPDQQGRTRYFEPLADATAANALLAALIRFDLAQLPLLSERLVNPVDVGVHLVRMVVVSGKPAVSSPPHLHKDGEPFTFIHLIRRHQIRGGQTVVAEGRTPFSQVPGRVIDRFTLDRPLESVAVSDSHVFHGVEPIEVAPGHGTGFRDVLLIDFTPMKRDMAAD